MDQQTTIPPAYTVTSWADAAGILYDVTEGATYSLGSGTTYPDPYAVFTNDALSGERAGYTVWTTKGGRIDQIVAYIYVR